MLHKEPSVHPFAEIFPMMDDEQFRALKISISENGIQEPVSFWNGFLVDGRNRWRACSELGVECDAVDLDCTESEMFAFVIDKNLHRRHLTTSQRAMVAAKMATLKQGRPSKEEKAQNCALIDDAAKLLNVSPRSVDSAKQVIEHAAPEIVQAVEQGQLPVAFAAKVATEEPDKKTQSKLWKQGGKKALKHHITEPSPYVDGDDEQREVAVTTIKRLWKKWDAVQRAAVRVWIDENYLEVDA